MFERRCDIHHTDVGDEAECRNAVVAPITCFGKFVTL